MNLNCPRVTGLVLACCLFAAADAGDPKVNVILPRGVQRGAEHVLTFSGARLNDAEEILFYEPGVEVVSIQPDEKNANIVRATVRVAPDCALGEHTAQVRTRTGISEYRTFFVGALPEVEEVEPNTEFTQAQPIEQNVTVSGVVQNEDVDYYLVKCTKGQRLSLEVEGMRFGQVMFDPYIAVLDMNRFELAAVDDSPPLRQDALLSVEIPEDGDYVVEVRESSYRGNGNCRYRLHVGQFPRPLAVFPAGGQSGAETEFRFIGDAGGLEPVKKPVPAEGSGEFVLHAEDDRGVSPSGITCRISPDPNSFEVEPNNSQNEATVVEFPSAMNGILETEGDHDYFRFTAKKGELFDVEVYGRRVGSGIDPVLHIFKAGGGAIAGNDDSRGPDSYLEFKVPEDGDYCVRIMDHLGRGGPAFVYRVEFQKREPSLTLQIPRVRRYAQDRQRIYVARGNRFGVVMSASRQNFGGELVVEDPQLPEGVTVTAPPMKSAVNTMPVVFEAAADAPLGGMLVDFRARLNDENRQISGGFTNRADFVIAGPGQSLYSWKDVDRLPVVVVDELPFTVDLIQPKVPLVRNGSMNLQIVATKKEGWDEDITVEFRFRPPGIGASSTVKIPKGQTTANYPINANGNAALGDWPVYVMATANVGGAAWASSPMRTLKVAEPYVNLALKRTAVELGQSTEVLAEVQILQEFEGNAEVRLVGLPHNVTADPLQITRETKELVFRVNTKEDSPAGNHKNIFCTVVLTQQEEPITHARVGSTEIRIDKPLPKPVEAPAAETAAAAPMPKPAPPAEKRLSRLEKLRLEAQKRNEGN